MKHQSVKDRMHEGEGMVRHEMRMHKGRGHSSHGLYRHEEDRPHQPMQGHPEHGHGAEDMKAQAMDIAYGQSGHAGMLADDKRLRSQFKNYHWADSPAVEAPGAY